jgi:hypothetical protein
MPDPPAAFVQISADQAPFRAPAGGRGEVHGESGASLPRIDEEA